MAEADFRHDKYALDLTGMHMAITFALEGVRERGKRLSEDAVVNDAMERMRKGLFMMAGSLNPEGKAKLEPEIEPTMARFKEHVLGGLGAEGLLLNLGLVLFYTQLEIFVNDLLDAVLRAEPRKFMDLFAKKNLTAKEAVEAGDYERVMELLRGKIIDEIDRQGTRGKFVKLLGEKFGLIEESEINLTFPGQAGPACKWNIDKLVEIFDQRHRVVHRSELTVTDEDYLRRIQVFFSAIEAVLTINAVRRYNVRLGPVSVDMAQMMGPLIGVPRSHMKEFGKKVRAAPSE